MSTQVDGRQAALRARAADLFPGGVNSPVRAFRSVGRPPLFLDAGRGPRVRDADGRWYLDYIGSWGPAILGHGHPAIVEAVREAALDGFALGRPTAREIELGERVRAAMPSHGADAVRLLGHRGRDERHPPRARRRPAATSSSSSRAAITATATASSWRRAPGSRRWRCRASAGRHRAARPRHARPPVQRPRGRRGAFAAHPGRIAAVIVEPVAGNMGVVAARARLPGGAPRADRPRTARC